MVLLVEEASDGEALDVNPSPMVFVMSRSCKPPEGLRAADMKVLGPSVGVWESTGLVTLLLESKTAASQLVVLMGSESPQVVESKGWEGRL